MTFVKAKDEDVIGKMSSSIRITKEEHGTRIYLTGVEKGSCRFCLGQCTSTYNQTISKI